MKTDATSIRGGSQSPFQVYPSVCRSRKCCACECSLTSVPKKAIFLSSEAAHDRPTTQLPAVAAMNVRRETMIASPLIVSRAMRERKLIEDRVQMRNVG